MDTAYFNATFLLPVSQLFFTDALSQMTSFINSFMSQVLTEPFLHSVIFRAVGNIEKVPGLMKLTFYLKREK